MNEREAALQDKLIAEQRGRQEGAPHSTGRGGAGNFNRSTSRNRDRDSSVTRTTTNGTSGTPKREGSQAPEFRATGRGGFGNIQEERSSIDLEKVRLSRGAKQWSRAGDIGGLWDLLASRAETDDQDEASRAFERQIQAEHRNGEFGKMYVYLLTALLVQLNSQTAIHLARAVWAT